MFKPSSEIKIKAKFTLSSNVNFKQEKKWIACNGEALVSKQELEIYEYLLEQDGIHVEYEKEFKGLDKSLFPDFTVINERSGSVFVWEHLGMTNSEAYLDRIPKKLEWYGEQGLVSIESGGQLILSFYRQERFFKDVVKFVELIKRS
ncbi:MAG: hypothetical protein H6598_01460 [Flavobacteriales bacterium]|nr:hypothetical protein [Flavobacteriales bacterium]